MDESHWIALDNYFEDVFGASENASKQSIPYTRAPKDSASNASKRKVIPGWSDLVAAKKEEAKFHYQLWLSAKKPCTDDIFNNMCHSRNQFKYAKRQCINAEKLIKRDEAVATLPEGLEHGILICEESFLRILSFERM